MKRAILCVLLGLPVFAQTLTITGPASVVAGNTVPLTLSISGTYGLDVAGLEWTVATPSFFALQAAAPASASTAASKTIYCTPTGNGTCLAIGQSSDNPPVITNAAYVDGPVATIQANIPANSPPGIVTIGLASLYGVGLSTASPTGTVSLPIVSGTTYTLQVFSRCDLNQDGSVDARDVDMVLSQILDGGSCPLASGCSLQTLQIILDAALPGGACGLQ